MRVESGSVLPFDGETYAALEAMGVSHVRDQVTHGVVLIAPRVTEPLACRVLAERAVLVRALISVHNVFLSTVGGNQRKEMSASPT